MNIKSIVIGAFAVVSLAGACNAQTLAQPAAPFFIAPGTPAAVLPGDLHRKTEPAAFYNETGERGYRRSGVAQNPQGMGE